MLSKVFNKSGISMKDFLIVFILIVNAVTWFFVISQLMIRITSGVNIPYDQKLIINFSYYIAIIGSCLLGAILASKIDRLKFIYLWILLGTLASLLLAVFPIFTFSDGIIISILLGVSFGLGLPSCLAYFAECTNFENRGKIAGISIFITLMIVTLFLITFEILNLSLIAIILAIWRGIGLIILSLKPKKQSSTKNSINVSFVSILKEKKFFLYFIAWFMFPLIDGFEGIIVERFLETSIPNFLSIMSIVEPLVASLSILVAGLLCDLVGRKKIILSGFLTLVLAYAIIGFNPYFEISWYLYFIIDGFSWGILILTFLLILWADLSQTESREKYYALGIIPFFVGITLSQLLEELISYQIAFTAAFSVASFFLFVAIIPLVFAPETLPEKKMELRRLRKFAEDAQKIREKYES